jgi:hypothetical protein
VDLVFYVIVLDINKATNQMKIKRIATYDFFFGIDQVAVTRDSSLYQKSTSLLG